MALCEARTAVMSALGVDTAGMGGDGGRGGVGGSTELPVELSRAFTYQAGANVTKLVVFTRLDSEFAPAIKP